MQEPRFHLETFSSPRLAPDDSWVTTALCHQHTLCHSGQGSVFQFRGKWHDRSAIFLLDARQAGRCREGDERVVRAAAAAVRNSEHEISVQERASILTARDELLEKTLRPTPSAVKIRLQNPDISMDKVRALLRACKKRLGQQTRKFKESKVSFRKFVHEMDQSMIQVRLIDYDPAFQWVGVFPPFLARLQQLMPADGGGRLFFDNGFHLAINRDGICVWAGELLVNIVHHSLLTVF